MMTANKKHKGRKSFQENKNSLMLFENTISGVATSKMKGSANVAMSVTASRFFFGVVSSFSFFLACYGLVFFVFVVILIFFYIFHNFLPFIYYILKHSV